MNYDLCEGCPFDGVYEPLLPRGPENARFLIVTDVPSMASAKDDRLMTNRQMNLLGTKLEGEGFDKGDFRFTPACHCAFDPDGHVQKVKTAALKHCRQHLLAEIERTDTELVIPLGAVAASQAFGKSTKITKVKGMVNQSEELGIPIFPLSSPGIVVAYPQNEPMFTADVASLARAVNADYDIALAASQQIGEYEIVTDLQFLIEEDPEIISFDTENTGLRWYQGGVDVRTYRPNLHKGKSTFQPRFQILTMQFSTEAGKGYMLVWDHPENPIPEQDKPRLRNQLRQLLCKEDRIVVGQNAKYDNVALWQTEGIRYRIGGDTLMLATLVDENMPEKNLDALTKIFVHEMGGYADVFNTTYDKARMWEVPLTDRVVDGVPQAGLLGYGVGDTDATFRLYLALEDIVGSDARQWAHYCRVTIPGLNAFAGMETRGMFIDEGDALASFKATMITDVTRMEAECLSAIPRKCRQDIVSEYMGRTNNKGHLTNKGKTVEDALSFSRPDFVKQVLFTNRYGFKLKPRVFTKTTAKLKDESLREPSTSAKDHLPYFFDDCPFTMQLAEYQKDRHLLNTNVVKFEENYIRGGKVRPNYHLHKAVTGRSSCVKGDTPIYTKRGVVQACDVRVGDKVWTHKERWKRVNALYAKPPTQMYRLTFSDGQTLTATGAHRLLTEDGRWVEIDSLLEVKNEPEQTGHGECESMQAGSGQLPNTLDNSSRTRQRIRNKRGNCEGDDSLAHIGSGFRQAKSNTLQAEQAGGKEPAVWKLSSNRFRGCGRLFDEVSQWTTLPCATDRNGGTDGDTDSALSKITSRASHRREQEEQRSGQPCGYYAKRPCQDTRAISVARGGLDIEKIEFAGVHRVYDWEVADDHSYFACGVFSHNSDDPNGQNYPKRGDRAMVYRRMFVPPPGYYVIEADLSQAELRIAASMSGDRMMIEIYRTGGDIHKATGAIVAGLTIEAFALLPKAEQKELRQKAKAVNFGFLYGMGWRKFIGYAKTQYNVVFTEDEAQRIRKGFFAKYRALAPWHESMREFAKQHKMVRSYTGRIRHLPMIDSPEEYIQQEAGRQAINSPVQETGSSLGVMSLGRMNEEIDPKYLQVVGFIHDAIVCYVKKEYVDWGMKTLKSYMQSNPLEAWFDTKIKVPIIADVGFGLNLGEVHECENFSLTSPFDYGSLRDKEGNLLIQVPRQKIPPNRGRLTRSVYTLPEDLEDEQIVVATVRHRMMRSYANPDVVKRIERSSKQMVINKRNQALKDAVDRSVRAGVIRRSRPAPVV